MEVSGKLAEAQNDLHLCENCQFENVTTKAKGICRYCWEYMCDACFRNHLTCRRNRNHELIDINDPDITARRIAEEVESCKQHDNEAIKFYCRKHDTVGCGDCMVLGHGTCQPAYIKDLSQNIQQNEDIINLKRKIEDLESKNHSNMETFRKNRKDSKAMHEAVLAEISKFRTDINNYLDDAEATILSEMKQLMSDNGKRLDQLDKDCAISTAKTEALKKKLDTTVQRENVLFIQTVRSKASVQEIEHELTQTTQAIRKVKRYEFVPSQQLASIIKTKGKLGQLNVSRLNESKRSEITTREREVDALTRRKPLQQDTDIKADVRPPPVVVGARVKTEDESGEGFFWVFYHQGQPGTVTAVHPNGTVDVKWDATGYTGNGYTVGNGLFDIYLI